MRLEYCVLWVSASRLESLQRQHIEARFPLRHVISTKIASARYRCQQPKTYQTLNMLPINSARIGWTRKVPGHMFQWSAARQQAGPEHPVSAGSNDKRKCPSDINVQHAPNCASPAEASPQLARQRIISRSLGRKPVGSVAHRRPSLCNQNRPSSLSITDKPS